MHPLACRARYASTQMHSFCKWQKVIDQLSSPSPFTFIVIIHFGWNRSKKTSFFASSANVAMTDSSSFVNLPTPLPSTLSSTTLPLFLLMTSASSTTTSPEMSIQSTGSRDLSLNLTNSTAGMSPFDLSSASDDLSPSGSELTDSSSVDSPLDSSEGSSMRFPFYLRFSATAICLLLLTIGCPGNLLVPYVVMKTKELRNSTNIFLMNLSVSDLMILLISSPTILIELHSQPETWFLGLFMCKY